MFIRKLAEAAKIDLGGDWSSTEALARERVARIHAAGIGSVSKADEEAAVPLSAFSSPDELWDALTEGGRWTGEHPVVSTARRATLATELAGISIDDPTESKKSDRVLKLVPRASRDTTLNAVVSPVLSKLYQESALRSATGSVTLNPRTAAALGFSGSRKARLLTAGGSLHVALSLDEAVMPGVVELAVSPDLVALGHKPRPGDRATIDLFVPAGDGSWSSVDAELVEG
jgi:hypothetical protein